LVPKRERESVLCWECEAQTADPVTVILGTPATIIGRLPLCSTCYEACYRPLVRQPSAPEAPVHAVLIVPRNASTQQAPW
jgi:hypothetical protein